MPDDCVTDVDVCCGECVPEGWTLSLGDFQWSVPSDAVEFDPCGHITGLRIGPLVIADPPEAERAMEAIRRALGEAGYCRVV